jgi:hypothetical protein
MGYIDIYRQLINYKRIPYIYSHVQRRISKGAYQFVDSMCGVGAPAVADPGVVTVEATTCFHCDMVN